MYPAKELADLRRRKADARARSAAGRRQAVEGATRVARPLAWTGRLAGFWRRAAPVVGAAVVVLRAVRRFRQAGKPPGGAAAD
jgi:hypothetical protein